MSASVFFSYFIDNNKRNKKKSTKEQKTTTASPSTKIYEFLLSIRFCFLPFYSITGPYFGKISEGKKVR